MTNLFRPHTKNEHADSLADYLPNDDRWAAKKIDGKNIRKLLLGFARQLRKGEDFLETVWTEADPSTTTAFINDWEKAVGIPDDCFPGTGTLEERRLHIVAKLTAAVQTATDFEELAALFGVNVNVRTGTEISTFPFTFPIVFVGTVTEAKYTIIVEILDELTGGFPYTFPITFENPVIDILKCFFNKLKPANTQVIFRQVV